MHRAPSQRARDLHDRLLAFMDAHVYPNERAVADEIAAGDRWAPVAVIEDLKARAREAGLWNLFPGRRSRSAARFAEPGSAQTPGRRSRSAARFAEPGSAKILPDSDLGAGLTTAEYAPLCETMGRVLWAPEVFNCSAPDTGNMEVLVRYGTAEQQRRWLRPLLDGEIRSCFAMTEPDVASSDATNIASAIVRDGDEYVVTGRKWWTTGAGSPRCRVAIVMGRSDPHADPYRQQSMILVPMDAPGVTVERTLTVFGYDEAPHGHAEIAFDDVRIPAANMLLGEGRGFEIAQGRLGPGRVHHCMRLIGLAERALEAMCQRALQREAFGRPIAEHGTVRADIARSRIEIDQARLLVLDAAERIDTVGAQDARAAIAMIKAVAPAMAQHVIDRAIQVHGGAGVSGDTFLAEAWASARSLRLADGPDEVHTETVAKLELRRHRHGP